MEMHSDILIKKIIIFVYTLVAAQKQIHNQETFTYF